MNAILQNPIAVQAKHRDEVNSWYCTPYELGQLCGFVSAAHWAIGEEWAFNEDNFDAPIDWKRFYNYMDKRSLKLRQRRLQEKSAVFQIFTNEPPQVRRSSEKMSPIRGIRSKLSSESADTDTDLPEVSSWLDW